MMMNTLDKFIFYYILIGLTFSQSDISIATESSIIPFQFTSASKPLLHIGTMHGNNGLRHMSGLQFQPTNNLLIGGVLSPHNIEKDLFIYYHIVIGYVSQRKVLNIFSNMFQVGIHRNRFGTNKDSRWSSFSLLESVRLIRLNINLCWNHLFTQNWAEDTFLISTDLQLSNNIYLSPGAIAYSTSNIDYMPFLFLSINL